RSISQGTVQVVEEGATRDVLIDQQGDLSLQTAAQELDHVPVVDLGKHDDFVDKLLYLAVVSKPSFLYSDKSLHQHPAAILLEELLTELGVLPVLDPQLYTGNGKQDDEEEDSGPWKHRIQNERKESLPRKISVHSSGRGNRKCVRNTTNTQEEEESKQSQVVCYLGNRMDGRDSPRNLVYSYSNILFHEESRNKWDGGVAAAFPRTRPVCHWRRIAYRQASGCVVSIVTNSRHVREQEWAILFRMRSSPLREMLITCILPRKSSFPWTSLQVSLKLLSSPK
ncbi:unnamed protein product, partial [Thlaspi arvense]